jgi:hypothetical protein
LTLLVLSALVTIFWYWWIMRHRAVPLLVFTALDYDAPLPPNAWASEDAKRLSEAGSGTKWMGGTEREIRVEPLGPLAGTSSENFLAALTDGLQSAKPGGPSKNVVLLYLSAHGVLDDDGQPVLLLGKRSKPSDTTIPSATLPERVSIESLLGIVKKDRPADSTVVLFLDAGRIDTNWQLGMLYNGFAEKLKQVVDAAAVPRLILINSTSPGQKGWCFSKRQGSAFGLAVADGLRGAARKSSRSNQVTLHELREYLQREVTMRVSAVFAACQEPLFLSSIEGDQDFGLAYVARSSPSRAAPVEVTTEQRESNGQALVELWRQHEKLYPWPRAEAIGAAAALQPVSVRPGYRLRFESFQQGLLRLEQLRAAGPFYKASADVLERGLEDLAEELGRHWQPDTPRDAPNLPLALFPLTEERETRLRTRIARHWPAPGKNAPPLTDLSPAEVAWAVWDRLLDEQEEIRGDSIRRALELVQTQVSRAAAEWTQWEPGEMRILGLLRPDGYLPSSVRDQPEVLKQALLAKHRAESATAESALSGLLALDAIRVFGDQGDRQRREALDLLFAGDHQQNAADRVAKALSLYEQADEAREILLTALSTRDRIWMEVPHLLQWWVATRGDRDDGKQRVEACVALFQEASELDRELYGQIAVWRQEYESPTLLDTEDMRQHIERLKFLAAQANEDLKEQNGVFAADWEGIDRVRDRSSLIPMQNLLNTPLITGGVRDRLKASCDVAYTSSSQASSGALPSERDRVAPGSTDLRAFWHEWAEIEHPASLLIRRRQQPRRATPAETADAGQRSLSAEVRSSDREAAEVRQQLHQLVSQIEGRMKDKPIEEGQAESPDDWQTLSQSAREISAVVTLLNLAGFDWKSKSFIDPLARLEKYYQAEFWLWHGRRVIDDFCGDDQATGSDPPYFVRKAEICFEEAEKHVPLPAIPPTRELSKNRNAAAVRWQSNTWLTLAPERIPLQPGADRFQLTLRPEFPEHVPEGWAAFSVEDPGRKLAAFNTSVESDASVEPSVVFGHLVPAISSEAVTLTCRIPNPEQLSDRSTWTVRAFYRGHTARRSCSLEVQRPGQFVQLETKKQPQPSSVRIDWEPQPGTVAFCLDCSESMGRDKMNHARNVLQDLLENLRFYPDHSVSLWLFGHRRFAQREGDQWRQTWNAAWEKKTGESDDPTVTFENDVQLVWQRNAEWLPAPPRLQRINQKPDAADWLTEVLDLSYGLTPLHLAMDRAVQEHLSKSSLPGVRRLVVLSDGKHVAGKDFDGLSFNPPWTYDARKDRTAEAVGESLREANGGGRQPIQVMLIGDVESAEDVEQLSRTAEIINGRAPRACEFIKDAFTKADIGHKVRRSLGLYEWSVLRDTSSERLTQQPRRRNDSFVFEPDDVPGRYRVELDCGGSEVLATANLAVEGGEALVLKVREDGSRNPTLVHHQPNRQNGQFDKDPTSAVVPNPAAEADEGTEQDRQRREDFQPQSFFVDAHPPRSLREASGWRFPISIQNGNAERFSPRPVEVWAEITPCRNESGKTESMGRPFVFYDPVWEPEQPVPVLLLDAQPWSAEGAHAARIQLWFKLRVSEGTEERSISSILREENSTWNIDSPPTELAVRLQPAKGIDRGWDVIVSERNLDIAAVEPMAASTRVRIDVWPRADVITRQSYPEAGRVQHTFRYQGVNESTVGGYKLRVTSFEAIRKGAAEFQTTQPLLPRR